MGFQSFLCPSIIHFCKKSEYSFKGKNYQLPINEPALGNAIHGLLARKSFTLVKQSSSSVTLKHEYKGEEPNYPFPFQFQYTYTLTDSGALEVTFEAKNTGSGSLPFACGWHPYFSFPDTTVDDLEINFKPISRFLSDSQMIPLKEENLNGKQQFKFSTDKIDHVFRLEPMEIHRNEFIDTKHQKRLILEQSSPSYANYNLEAGEQDKADSRLLLLSARSDKALKELIYEYRHVLATKPENLNLLENYVYELYVIREKYSINNHHSKINSISITRSRLQTNRSK